MRRSVLVGACAAIGWLALPIAAVTLVPRTGMASILLPFVVAVAFLVVGTIATRWRPDHRAAWWLLATGVAHVTSFAATGASVHLGLWWLAVLATLSFLFGFVAFTGLLTTFPDGAYRPRWSRHLVRGTAGTVVVLLIVSVLGAGSVPLVVHAGSLPETVTVPFRLTALEPYAGLVAVSFFAPVLGLVAAGLRYRSAGAEDRQRMRWPMLAAVLAGSTIVLSLLGRLPTDIAAAVALCTVPLSLLVGMLRHRLFDVDLAIVRTLVVGGLWIAIAAVYVGAAGALGILTGDRSSLRVGIGVALAAGLVFQPARQRMERLVDGWIRGRREDPFARVARLTADLEQLTDAEAVRRTAARQVEEAVEATWVEVADVDAPRPDAALVVPLVHGTVSVGALVIGPREAGAYGRSDRALLAALAVPIALALRTSQLTEVVAARVQELAASRRRIVEAQETERRRIERDLHDGIQQDLIALMTGVELVKTRLATDPASASRTLDDLGRLAADTHRNLRSLVRGIYPAVLTDQGVLAAIEARFADLPLGIELIAEGDVGRRRFAPELEGAAYFLVSEGLTNVVRHAAVSDATVLISACADHLEVEVRDRGAGFSDSAPLGTGLRGLADRFNALGGELTVVSDRNGTSLRGRLPCQEEHDG